MSGRNQEDENDEGREKWDPKESKRFRYRAILLVDARQSQSHLAA
jgi:hypothetical protein